MKQIITILMLIVLASACNERLYEVKETKEIMGTYVTITVHHEDKSVATDTINKAFTRRINEIDALLSTYKNNSEISLLNKNKLIKNPSKELLDNINKSIYYGKLSDGNFDITVQPILDLYKKSFGINERPPTKEEIEAEIEKIDYSKIQLNNNQISIDYNQKITLGGIAKGYAVDEAIQVLKQNGIKNAIVNAGGDMKGVGKKYGTLPWTIALTNPRNKDEFITTIDLNDKSIVTSGDYERYFNENKSFHHIVSPKTGYSATELISVTILTDSAFDADAISTSVFVLGKEKGLELVDSLDNTEALIITSDRKIIKTFI